MVKDGEGKGFTPLVHLSDYLPQPHYPTQNVANLGHKPKFLVTYGVVPPGALTTT